MLDRPALRLPALLVLLAPASALAASIDAHVSKGRVAGWYGLALVQLLALVALVWALAKTFGKEPLAHRTKAMILAGVTFALGVGTVVMADTEPVIQHRFLDQDTIDLIEMVGYAEAALALACGALAYYAEQISAAFAPPERAPLVEDLPPEVKPERPSIRRRRGQG